MPEQIDRAFVEKWSGRYRDDLEGSPWRPGPALRSAIRQYPELEALLGFTNGWEFEQYAFDTIGTAARKTNEFTISDLIAIGYWKAERQLPAYLSNDADRVSKLTGIALRNELEAQDRADILAILTGVGTPVASALLTVWSPDEYTIIDFRALATLHAHDEVLGDDADKTQQWWERRYDRYVSGCQRLRERCLPYSLRDLDRALWKWNEVTTPR